MNGRARTIGVEGQKRMRPEHARAGCEIQVSFNMERDSGFVSVSLTKEQAYTLRDKLSYTLSVFYEETP